MSPAAGGAAPTQPAAASFEPAPAPTAAIGAPPQQPENLRDPALHADGADPGNAAARKPAWNVPPPPAAPVGGGIIGGDESWPALTESAAAARTWPKSASSDSLRSLSDGSAPSAPEDVVVPSQPVSNPISTAPSPPSTSPPPPPSATTTAPSPQNGGPSQPDLVRHGGGHGGNSGGGGHGGNNGGADHGGNSGGGGGGNGSTRSRSTGNNSSDGNSSSGGDGNWNDGGLGGGSNMNSSVHSGGIGGSGIDNSRRVFGSNNWNGNGRGGGGYNNGNGDEGNRYNGGSRGSGGHWNNNGRSGSGSSNGFGGRGGRNRRDHDRGGNFSARNYSRALPSQQQQQQQPSFYQPGPFQRPPPPPPAAHFMMPQPYVPYVPPFAYPGDVQAYPFYVSPLEQQFQNMHLIQQPMQPLEAQQDQPSLQHDIRNQIEHYFSTNNLCHDTHLRGCMDDQGWVPIDVIASFPRVNRFRMLGVDTNYILDSLQGSELLEVQGNNIRRRNDWAAWLLHRRPPPSN